MSQTGLGVMIRQLTSNRESVDSFKSAIDKQIKRAWIDSKQNGGDGGLCLRFEDGSGVMLFDNGRSCCESRYLSTDDDLGHYSGARLRGADVSEGPETKDEYGEPHETAFLKVQTDKGTFTVVTHNEHNGYYGGFSVECQDLEPCITPP